MDKSRHLFPAAASIEFRFRGKLPDMTRHFAQRRIAKPGYVFLTRETRIEPLLVIEINALT